MSGGVASKVTNDSCDANSEVAELKIDFYFDFISPYGWIGAEQIGAIARKFGRCVHWHPFLLKATVLEAMGMTPPLETPLKGDYLLNDIGRSIRYNGLHLSSEARFGFSSVAASRAVLWTRTTSSANLEHMILELYRAHWSQGLDISDAETVLDIVEGVGLSRVDASEALKDIDVKKALYDETSEAIRIGVFGSPTIIVDGEKFWGADRLDMVEAWLKEGGW